MSRFTKNHLKKYSEASLDAIHAKMQSNHHIQADGPACHAAGVTSESEESKTKRWPAARQAAPRLLRIPLAAQKILTYDVMRYII